MMGFASARPILPGRWFALSGAIRYLSMFQMSCSSFHRPASFCQTTAYLSSTSCSGGALVIIEHEPISRAALPPSGFTSSAVHLRVLLLGDGVLPERLDRRLAL